MICVSRGGGRRRAVARQGRQRRMAQIRPQGLSYFNGRLVLCLLQPDHVPAEGLEGGLYLALRELGFAVAPGLHRFGILEGVGGAQILGVHLDVLRELPAPEAGDVQLQGIGALPAPVDDEDVQLFQTEESYRYYKSKKEARNITVTLTG